MSPFAAYLILGWEHILDPAGYDHLLFLLALLATQGPKAWRRIIILVTAFTLGHSLTLAWTALKGPLLPSTWVEFLIPVTILLTSLGNLVHLSRPATATGWGLSYVLTTFFGLIHGMGFSSFFRSLLGADGDILLPLLSFNLGIEAGQLCFVALILALKAIAERWLPSRTKILSIALSLVAAGLAIHLLIQKLPL